MDKNLFKKIALLTACTQVVLSQTVPNEAFSQDDILNNISSIPVDESVLVEKKQKTPSSTQTFFSGSKNPSNFFEGKNVTNGLIPNRVGGYGKDIFSNEVSADKSPVKNDQVDESTEVAAVEPTVTETENSNVDNTVNNSEYGKDIKNTSANDIEVQAALEHSRKIRDSIFGASGSVEKEAKLIKSTQKSKNSSKQEQDLDRF